jgi:hypothetical protein
VFDHQAPAAPPPGPKGDPLPAFPIELVIETDGGRALLQADPRMKVIPTPEFAHRLCRVLPANGHPTLRVIKPVMVEDTSNQKPWQKRDRKNAD